MVFIFWLIMTVLLFSAMYKVYQKDDWYSFDPPLLYGVTISMWILFTIFCCIFGS